LRWRRPERSVRGRIKGEASMQRISSPDKRPKTQLVLAFMEESRGEASTASRGGTESAKADELDRKLEGCGHRFARYRG
jgi:hypothetical protein